MSGARNHVDNIAVVGQDARHGSNRAFEPFVGRKQPKSEKDTLALARETLLIYVRLLKRQAGDAMRNQFDLLCRDIEDLLQDTRGVLAHDDEALRACGNALHYIPLVRIRFTKHRMQSCDYRHVKVLQQLHDVASRLASEDSVFML